MMKGENVKWSNVKDKERCERKKKKREQVVLNHTSVDKGEIKEEGGQQLKRKRNRIIKRLEERT
jgi:hypothetical protein